MSIENKLLGPNAAPIQLNEEERLRVIERFPEVFDRIDGVNVDAVMRELHDFIEVMNRYHWFISRCTKGMSHGKLYHECALEAQVQEAEQETCTSHLQDFIADIYDSGCSIIGDTDEIGQICEEYEITLPKGDEE